MGKESLGMDILTKDIVEPDKFKKTLSEIFSINLEYIEIDDNEFTFSDTTSIKIFCTLFDVQGDFKSLYGIFIRDDKLKFDEIEVAKKISFLLDTVCVIADDSQDPFAYLEIFPEGKIQNVFFDEDKFSEDIYSIQR